MKKLLFILLLMPITHTSIAQVIEGPVIVVPEKFEFLKEENKYQLNALTHFLFEKYGFRSFYEEPVPPGTDPCEILAANVHDESGLFRSKVYVTLEDCNGKVVFTSRTGSSREKEFKRSYHEALREAFESVVEDKADIINSSEATIATMDHADPSPVRERVEVSSKEMPKYQVEDRIYHLKNTDSGMEIFKEGDPEKFATLLRSGNRDTFIYISEDRQGTAYFDDGGNLVVEYPDPETGTLETLVFRYLQ